MTYRDVRFEQSLPYRIDVSDYRRSRNGEKQIQIILRNGIDLIQKQVARCRDTDRRYSIVRRPPESKR